jgi:hypothetical protein
LELFLFPSRHPCRFFMQGPSLNIFLAKASKYFISDNEHPGWFGQDIFLDWRPAYS